MFPQLWVALTPAARDALGPKLVSLLQVRILTVDLLT
jgi:hypothetical protein